MTYIGILIGGVAGFLYWKYVGCVSGTCPLTSNKFITIAYGALLGSLLFSTIAGSTTKHGFFSRIFGGDSTSASFQTIDAGSLQAIAEDENTVVIDVRTPEEWKSGFIPGTDMFIDFRSPDFAEKIDSLDRSKNYVLYCRSGNRSGKACQILKDKGFEKVNNLSGGVSKWDGELKRD